MGINLTGSFTADEVPSMTGNWTGTITCTALCPAGSTVGNLTMTLSQDDSTGLVVGTFAVTGLPGFSSGTLGGSQFDLLSGSSWQDDLVDQNGSDHVVDGGPLNSFNTAGLGTDRSFHGSIGIRNQTTFYLVDMTH